MSTIIVYNFTTLQEYNDTKYKIINYWYYNNSVKISQTYIYISFNNTAQTILVGMPV